MTRIHAQVGMPSNLSFDFGHRPDIDSRRFSFLELAHLTRQKDSSTFLDHFLLFPVCPFFHGPGAVELALSLLLHLLALSHLAEVPLPPGLVAFVCVALAPYPAQQLPIDTWLARHGSKTTVWCLEPNSSSGHTNALSHKRQQISFPRIGGHPN